MTNFKGGFAFNNEAAKVEVEQSPNGALISCINPVTGESMGGGNPNSVQVKEQDKDVYLTFRNEGRKSSFDSVKIQLPAGCTGIWFDVGHREFEQVLEKREDGSWKRCMR